MFRNFQEEPLLSEIQILAPLPSSGALQTAMKRPCEKVTPLKSRVMPALFLLHFTPSVEVAM